MAEQTSQWIIERGIGEVRALLIERDEVKAAKLYWPGDLCSGLTLQGRLTAKAAGARRGTVTIENGTEVLVDHLPAELTEGQQLYVKVVRAPLHERGRFKRGIGRYVSSDEVADLSEDAFPDARQVGRFPTGLWEEVWLAASSGVIEFEFGQVMACATPAMTLIDVDGPDNPRRTANASVTAVARAIRWFDIGGSIGIDFPTVHSKADRKYVDALISTSLCDWPHERTAMNGFGFVQIVARLEGPSLLHRFATSRVGMAARMLLRRGELAQGHGPVLLLTCHPAIKAKLKPEWLAALARRSGREVRVETEPGLALTAGHAQILADG